MEHNFTFMNTLDLETLSADSRFNSNNLFMTQHKDTQFTTVVSNRISSLATFVARGMPKKTNIHFRC